MSRCFASSYVIPILYLILVLVQIHKSSSDPVTTLIGLVSGIWSLYEYTKMYVAQTPVNQNWIDTQLSVISVENHLSRLRSRVNHLRQDIVFDRQMEKLASKVKKIEVVFNDYKRYKENFNKTATRNLYANDTYKDYVHTVFRGNFYGLAEILDEISEIVAPSSEHMDIPATDTLVASSEEFGNFCSTRLSQIQLFRELLGHLTVVQTKGLLMTLFAYDVKEWLHQGDFAKERDDKQKKSIDRSNRIVRKFKTLIAPLSNEIHACDPFKHENIKTYVELENLFQTLIINEHDMTDILNCKSSCTHLEDKVPDCLYQFKNSDKETLCKKTYKCDTPLKNCKPLKEDPAFKKNTIPKACLSWNPFGNRRYSYLSFNDDDSRTCKVSRVQRVKDVRAALPYKPLVCATCQCTCANGNKIPARYKFSKMTTLTDIDKNYVMTGARFVMRKNVIHVQVQQAKLTPHGGIEPRTDMWIPLPKHDSDVHEITWTDRGVNLDSLRVPEGHAVVGLRLKTNRNGKSQHIELQIMHLPFNYTSGLLDNRDPDLTIASHDERSELQLENKDYPTRSYIRDRHIRDSKDDQYILFQQTGLEQDGGQSTIPYIDTQDVQPYTLTPLSGIGLVHRGNQQSGGFLGLNLFTYNYTSHMQEEHVLDQELIRSFV